MGVIFDVYNEIGGDHYEKFIQKAIAVGLEDAGLLFSKEEKIPLIYKNKRKWKYYPDFVIDNKIVLEIKRGYKFKRSDYNQVEAYLEAKNLKLGIIVLFTKTKVKFVRVLN